MQSHADLAATAVDMSWARMFVDQADRECASMVDSMLAENEQLEALTRLLATHVDSAVKSPQAKSAHSSIMARIEEMINQGSAMQKQQVKQIDMLHSRFKEAEVEAQQLRDKLDDSHHEIALLRSRTAGHIDDTSVKPNFPFQSIDSKSKRAEHAEARCVLIESRCQRVVQRLEIELACLHAEVGKEAFMGSACGDWPATSGGAQSKKDSSIIAELSESVPMVARAFDCTAQPGHQSVYDEVIALRSEIARQRDAQQRHIALYQRYLPDIAVAWGQTLPAGLLGPPVVLAGTDDCPGDGVVDFSFTNALEVPSNAYSSQQLLGSQTIGSGQCPVESFLSRPLSESSQGFPNADALLSPAGLLGAPATSDDEDYTWEGYLEQPVVPGVVTGAAAFKKVYVEVSRSELTLSEERASRDALRRLPFSALAGPAALAGGAARCFEVPLQGEVFSLAFRCVSERRAVQWVEAVNRAWHSGHHVAGFSPMPAAQLCQTRPT